MNDAIATLLARAKALDIEQRIALVQAIWDSIRRERPALRWAALRASEEAFARVWDNPEDAVYDELPARHREVLDQRLAELALDPAAECSWDEVKANLERLSDSPHGSER